MRPTQAIPAEALTAEKAKMPAPITAPASDLLSAVIFNPPFMLSNVKLTAQLGIGSTKTDPANFKSGHWASKQASTHPL
jgi:hypothetical protein